MDTKDIYLEMELWVTVTVASVCVLSVWADFFGFGLPHGLGIQLGKAFVDVSVFFPLSGLMHMR